MKKILLTVGLGMTLLVVGCTEEAAPQKEEVKQEEKTPKESTPKVYIAGLSNNTFVDSLQAFYSDIDPSVTIAPEIDDKMLMAQIGQLTAFTSGENDEGELNYAAVLHSVTADQMPETAVDYVMAANALIGVFNPEILPEDRTNIILYELSLDNIMTTPGGKTKVIGGNKYNLYVDQTNGLVILKVSSANNLF